MTDPGASTRSPAAVAPEAIRAPRPRPGAFVAADPFARWTPWLLGALLAVVAARFVRLDIDPPYAIVSNSGEFLTDEGWYTQAAQLHTRFGQWTSEWDLVWLSGNALFSLVYAAAFEIAGSTLMVARTVSCLFSCVSLAAFYGLIRTVMPRSIALATCVIASVTLHTVAYSRIAIIEPTGVAVSMLALFAWVKFPRVRGSMLGLLLAVAAYFVKQAFIFTACVLAFLALLDIVVLVRERRWRGASAIAASILAAPFAAKGLQLLVNAMAPEDAAVFAQWHVKWRAERVLKGKSLLETIRREAHYVASAFKKLALVTNTLAPAAALFAGVTWIVVRAKGRVGIPRSRAVVAMAAFLVAGTTMFGLFESQPVRYFAFAILPLTFLGVTALCAVVPESKRLFAVVCLLGAHLAVQAPGYMIWLGRGGDLATTWHAAEDAVSRMDLEDPPAEGVAVIGDTAAYVSFFDPRIRPLGHKGGYHIREKVDRWRPRYLFDFPERAKELARDCEGLVERVEWVRSYAIMHNYTTEEDFALYRIVYRR